MKFSLKIILFFAGLITIGIWTLYFADGFFGDDNGYVLGVNLDALIVYVLELSILLGFIFLYFYKKIWFQNLLLASVTAIFTIVAVEFTFGILLKIKAKKEQKIVIKEPKFGLILDENLGFKLPANKKMNYVETANNEVVYNNYFETDSSGFRITPYPAENETIRDKYALFLGCSFTFGQGVDNNQTTSYFFQEKNKEYKSYNLGICAYGPHQMLARFQEGKLQNLVKQKEGIAIYTYIPDHINRAVAGSHSFFYMEGNAPYFKEKNGQMVRYKLFRDRKYFPKLFYNVIVNSNFFQYFKIRYPFKYSKSDYEFMADILAESSKLYQQQFKNDNFYVLFYPTKEDHSIILNRLKEKHVQVLDYSKLFDADQPQFHFNHDAHPSALANQIIIKQVVKDLNLTKTDLK